MANEQFYVEIFFILKYKNSKTNSNERKCAFIQRINIDKKEYFPLYD